MLLNAAIIIKHNLEWDESEKIHLNHGWIALGSHCKETMSCKPLPSPQHAQQERLVP